MNAEFTQWLKDHRNDMEKFMEIKGTAPSAQAIDEIIKARETGGR